MTRKIALIIAIVLGVVVLGVFLLQTPAKADLSRGDPVQGQVLYDANCAACHGADLEGQPNWRRPNADGTLPAPPHDASGHTWHHPSDFLFDYTKLGGDAAIGVSGVSSAMPAFEGALDDNAIWDILAYIRSTWPPEIQEAQAQ